MRDGNEKDSGTIKKAIFLSDANWADMKAEIAELAIIEGRPPAPSRIINGALALYYQSRRRNKKRRLVEVPASKKKSA